MDCETQELSVMIPVETYEALELYVKRANGNFDNEVSRLLNFAIDNKYKKFPNLLEK